MHCAAVAIFLSVVGLPAATDVVPRQQFEAYPRSARAAAPARPVSPAWADEPAELGAEARGRLQVATDGKGHYVAFVPYGEEKLLFAGDARTLHSQRIIGSSANGATRFEYRFWEPRAGAAWQASFDYKDGQIDLQCGEQPTRLKLLAPGEAKELLAKAKLLAPRWRREAFALARDGAATSYFVDRLRQPDDSRDFRLYMGKRGKLRRIGVEDALLDEAGQVFITPAGRLEFTRGDDGGRTAAAWVQGAKRTPLSALEVAPQIRFAYTALGVYAGERLGTACDWAY